MRDVLSGALPAPQDEPPQRDVVDAAMDWGSRRRRRDWALSGAAALAVVAIGAGVAAMSGGSGNEASPGGGPWPSASGSSVPLPPPGSWWTSSCDTPATIAGSLADYCGLFTEEQNFRVDFAKGSVPFIQKALPPGFSVRATDTYVLILTGPQGTNYLFPSVEPASTLDGHANPCTTEPSCVQTSTVGGVVVAGNATPSGAQSAGYIGNGLHDPRVDILVGTSAQGGMNGMAPPTAGQLLSNEQLARIAGDPGLLQYATAQLAHITDITRQLQSMAPPPSATGSFSPPPSTLSPPAGNPSTGATGSWSSPPSSGWSSSGIPSWGQPSGGGSSWSPPPTRPSSIPSQPSASGTSAVESWPSSPPTMTTSP
jgi:hypothetical protein